VELKGDFLLLCCSTALLLYRYAVCVVFVAATFTVALFFVIRRLKTCDYILHGFTASRLHASRFTKKISLYPSLRIETPQKFRG